MVNSLIGNNAKIVIQNLSLKIGIFAIGYGLLVGVGLHNINPFLLQAIIIVIMFLIIKYIFINEDKNYDFSDMALVYVLHYLIGSVIGIIFFSLMNLLGFEYRLIPIITYLKSAFIIFIACWRVDFNKLFVYVASKILIKLMLFVVLFIFIITLAVLGFNALYIAEYVIFFLVLIIVVLVWIMMTVFGAQTQIDDLDAVKAKLETQYDVDVSELPEKEVQKKVLVSHPRIVVKHQKGTDSVYVDSIMYIELCNRKTKIMLENGQELLTSKTIGFWKKQLTSKNFGHPSQSYIVNFQHMDCIIPEEREITMDNGKKFTIPIRKVRETDNAFQDYLENED